MDTPLDHAQEEAIPLMEWALTPLGHCKPKEEYANVIASTNHLEILCFVTGPPLVRLQKATKAVLAFFTRQNAKSKLSRPWRGRAGTPGCPSGGVGFRITLESLGPNSRQAGLMERTCRSPTRLTNASVSSRPFFNESSLRLMDCNGTNGGPFRAFSTVGKS